MNILLLMAGPSDAFREAGYAYPKNLIEINGLPLMQRVTDSLAPLHRQCNQVISLVQEEEDSRYHTGEVLHLLIPSAIVLHVQAPTKGAACTALLAIEHINNKEPLLIVNGDQIVVADLVEIVNNFKQRKLDGGIVVFDAVHPRWSYVKCNDEGFVVEAAEKRPISNLATAGLYYFAQGANFVSSVMNMIKKDAQVEGNFYVCPCYNEMILQQARIGISKIPRNCYFSLSHPQGVQAYEDYLKLEA